MSYTFDPETEYIEKEVTLALNTYTLEEILEQSDLTESEVLVILVREGHLKLPEILPVG